jgi:hypothetical protein
MDARFYNSEDIDLERLASDLVNAYQAQGYKAQYIGDQKQIIVQLKKGGDFEAILGMQAALSLSLQRTTGGVLAMIGQQRWIDKAAVGAIGIAAIAVLWPLAVTAGVGAIRQASLANQALNMVDGLVRQQHPGVVGGAVPSYLLPQVQQQWSPLPPPSKPAYSDAPPAYVPSGPVINAIPAPGYTSLQRRCGNCNTPYEQGDTFCTGCGRPLVAQKIYCSNCNNELKPGVAFCPRCGTTNFSPVVNAPPAPRPAPAPIQPTVTYTPAVPQPPRQETPFYKSPSPPPSQPAKPETPVYTPPPQPAKPETPVYTPPPQPVKPETPPYVPPTPSKPAQPPVSQVYYVPSQQKSTDVNTSATAKPAEPYYVPPTTQEPPVKPQPKVTIIPSTPKQEPPPPQKPRPQKQYYIPSNPAQAQPAAPIPIDATVPAPMPATIPATPIVDGQKEIVWGTLTFGDGQQMPLSGERLAVGRYDHDMGGLHPEIDLRQMDGADTVSRIHAALEHIAHSYTLTDLNSTNATRINGKRLEPDKPQVIMDGDTLQFGKITCTFKKA